MTAQTEGGGCSGEGRAFAPAGISDAAAFVMLVNDYANIPASQFATKYQEFCEHRSAEAKQYRMSHEEATMSTFIWIAERLAADTPTADAPDPHPERERKTSREGAEDEGCLLRSTPTPLSEDE